MGPARRRGNRLRARAGRRRGRGPARGALAARRVLARVPGQVPRGQRPPQADAAHLGGGRRGCPTVRVRTPPCASCSRARATTATGTASSAGSTSPTCAWRRTSTSSRPRTWPTPRPGRRAARSTGSSPVDTDLDGLDEILVTSPGQTVVIDPVEGGGIGSWDIRAVRHALTAVMRRRPEAYHRALIEHESPPLPARRRPRDTPRPASEPAERAEAPATHPRDPSGPPSRASPTGSTTTATSAGPGSSTCSRRARPARRSRRPRRWSSATPTPAPTRSRPRARRVVRLTRDVAVGGDDRRPGREAVHLRRRPAGSPASASRSGSRTARTGRSRSTSAIEWALMLLGGGGNPAAYYEIDGGAVPHDGEGDHPAIDRVVSGNRTSASSSRRQSSRRRPPGGARSRRSRTPRYGFERTYQGSALVVVWPVELGARRATTVRVDQHVDDRIAIGPGNPSARGLRSTG